MTIGYRLLLSAIVRGMRYDEAINCAIDNDQTYGELIKDILIDLGYPHVFCRVGDGAF